MAVQDVPGLVKLLVSPSHHRAAGTHSAQPVLCRAGPGTGKTWMVKQALYLLAERLVGDKAGDGIRLVPLIVFVQRIVRLLTERGDEPATLLANPEGLLRWYINNEFADRKEQREMLLQAYELRALVVLIDGVDEAAGQRDVIETLVHNELVPSGNRLVVTSRPEGVDLVDYKTCFVVLDLLPLSQEQQRLVIQMQLQGNTFFENLVIIGECRRLMDKQFTSAFPTADLRSQIEALAFSPAGGAGPDRSEPPSTQAAPSIASMGGTAAVKTGPFLRGDSKKLDQLMKGNKSFLKATGGSAPANEAFGSKGRPDRGSKQRNDPDLPQSTALAAFERDMQPGGSSELLDQLDTILKGLPIPSTRAQILGAFSALELKPPPPEVLIQMALLRKHGLPAHERRSVPWMWDQVKRDTASLYATAEELAPVFNRGLATLLTSAGVPAGLMQTSTTTFRDPVMLWMDVCNTEDELVSAWPASLTLLCETGDQCLTLLKKLLTAASGGSVASESNRGMLLQTWDHAGMPAELAVLRADNHFAPSSYHPLHLRSATCYVQLTYGGAQLVYRVQIGHRVMFEQYAPFEKHYLYFWHQAEGAMLQSHFDSKFEARARPQCPPHAW